MSRSGRRVAFIRGIGPATHKVMPLAALCSAFEKRGLADASSVLATGNIVFRSSVSSVQCKAEAEAAIRSFGLAQDVFVRDGAALQRVVEGCPFPIAARERPSQLLVFFFDSALPPDRLDALLKLQGPERVAAVGNTLCVDFDGRISDSKLAPERKLGLRGTSRNWNTVMKIQTLLAEKEM